MEILLLIAVFVIIIFINIADFLPSLQVNEEDIGRNIDQLKKHDWFQRYLADEKLREQIIHDQHVRKTIGKFNGRKLSRDSYQLKCQKRLDNLFV